MQAYRLRYKVFCETLGWMPRNPSGLEVDQYDQSAESVGLFEESGTLVGMIRFIPPDQPFMLDGVSLPTHRSLPNPASGRSGIRGHASGLGRVSTTEPGHTSRLAGVDDYSPISPCSMATATA